MKRLVLVCLSVMAAAILAVPLPSLAQAPAAATGTAAAAPTQPAPKPAEPTFRVVDTANSTEQVVSMVFDETPLSDVIKAFRDATGANIISSGTNLQTAVSIRLDNVPWRKGLASILDPQGLQLLEQPAGSGIFVVTAKTLEIPKVTRTFELNHAKAEDVALLFKTTLGTGGIASAFKAANVVIVTATEQQLAECEKIISSVDKQTPQVYIEVRFAELSASASKKLGMKWDSLGGNGWGVNFDGATLGYSKTSGKSKTSGSSTSAGSSSSDEQTGTSSSLTDDSYVDDVRSTSGSIKDSLTRTIKSAVSDTASATHTTSKTHTRDTAFTGSLSMDAFSLTMNAFEQIDGVSIFSNPKIIVANEQEAMVDMTTKEPNLTITTTRTGTNMDQIDISSRLEVIPGEKGDKDGVGKGLFAGEAFFSYGISLKVTPRVSPTGTITLLAEPSISNLKEYYEFSGVSENTPTPRFPIIYMQRIQTVFNMQSGSTAVIGGLTKTTEESIDSGIPYLRSLPWVGSKIFGWKSREKVQKEIIIFVTVGIVDPATLPEDTGMPKNAILGRDLLNGKMKEPGDRTREEVLSLKDPKPAKKTVRKPVEESSATATPQPEPAPVPAAAPTPAAAPAPIAAAPAPAPVISEREAAKPTVIEPLLQN